MMTFVDENTLLISRRIFVQEKTTCIRQPSDAKWLLNENLIRSSYLLNSSELFHNSNQINIFTLQTKLNKKCVGLN